MKTNAWHLRQDGAYFPVKVHLYPMEDADLSSEAEVSSFIIKTESKDRALAEYVIDAWLALLIEQVADYDVDAQGIVDCISNQVQSLPYKFAYELSISELIAIHNKQNNYDDIDSLYQFVDTVKDNITDIQTSIAHSFNQQFCRVRYGGKYDTVSGNNSIWFRISSVGFNWANTIYLFVSEMKRKLHLDSITICRDPESDAGYGYCSDDSDYFYVAKDGSAYYMMPIDEYLAEEHEHSPVFSANSICRGVIATIRKSLSAGNTLEETKHSITSNYDVYVPHNMWSYLTRREQNMCIEGSEWSDSLPARTFSKIAKVKDRILQEFVDIKDVDIDYKPRPNTKGRMVGFEMLFTLTSDITELDGLVISIVSTKPLGDVLAESLVRKFRIEYTDYINFKNI